MSGNGGCGTSGFVGSISAGMEAVCGCRVRICGRAGCSCSALWETWSFCCSRTVSRVRMTGENVSESVSISSIPLASSLRRCCFFRFFRMYSFALISGSANCVVSVFSAAGISRREETSGFSLGRVRADGCTVGVVADADDPIVTVIRVKDEIDRRMQVLLFLLTDSKMKLWRISSAWRIQTCFCCLEHIWVLYVSKRGGK